MMRHILGELTDFSDGFINNHVIFGAFVQWSRLVLLFFPC